MNCYIYIFKHTFSQLFVQYTLKLVHITPNIQTNLNTVKLHYSNIKMECSVFDDAGPAGGPQLHYCEANGRLDDWGDAAGKPNYTNTCEHIALFLTYDIAAVLSFSLSLSVSIIVLCAK